MIFLSSLAVFKQVGSAVEGSTCLEEPEYSVEDDVQNAQEAEDDEQNAQEAKDDAQNSHETDNDDDNHAQEPEDDEQNPQEDQSESGDNTRKETMEDSTKKVDAAIVPTAGLFFLHDDRFNSRKGGKGSGRSDFLPKHINKLSHSLPIQAAASDKTKRRL
jgi:hypothetical protein